MKLAFDLVTDLSIHIAPHHVFELVLTEGDAVLEESRGRDTFTYNAMLLPGQPLTATGRTVEHAHEPDLRGLRGTPGAPTQLALDAEEPFERLSLWLDNNLILSQGQLQTYYSLRCRADGRDILVPLSAPVFRVSWEGQGLFRIELAPLGQIISEAELSGTV